MAALVLTPACVALANPKARPAARVSAKAPRLAACRLQKVRPSSRSLRVCASQEKVNTASGKHQHQPCALSGPCGAGPVPHDAKVPAVNLGASLLSPAAAGTVTDSTWKELVLDSPVPVVIDFWAPW
jgi:hypothetical protein